LGTLGGRMSNEANDKIYDKINDEVSELWCLPSRPDLEADCCNYVWEHYEENNIATLVISFLSKLCYDAVSSDDIKYLAKLEEIEKNGI
jgi:hypothetical protein